MTTTEIWNYLYTTPFTLGEGERARDMLGWRRARAALQRLLFPTFTVLTKERSCAEASLTMRVVCEAIGRRPDHRTLRDLEMLFGLALEVKHPGENPFGILNIERIRAYRKSKKVPFVPSDEYLHNLGYGIGPHYASVLRRFDLIDDNDCPNLKGLSDRRALSEVLGLAGPKKSVQNVVRVAEKWFKSGVNERDLKELYKTLWKPMRSETGARESCWRSFLLGDEHFRQPEYAHLRAIANFTFPRGNREEEHLVANADALRRNVYRKACSVDARELASLMMISRAFEVVAGMADFWLDALISFSMEDDARAIDTKLSHNPTSGVAQHTPHTLRIFAQRYAQALEAITPMLDEALKTIEGVDCPEAREIRAFATNIRERARKSGFARAMLEVILERHVREKGSQASVRLGAGGELFFCGNEPGYSGRSMQLLEKLGVASSGDTLLEGFSTLDAEAPTRTDEAFKEFVSDLFVWNVFGRWFGLLEHEGNGDACDETPRALENER